MKESQRSPIRRPAREKQRTNKNSYSIIANKKSNDQTLNKGTYLQFNAQ